MTSSSRFNIYLLKREGLRRASLFSGIRFALRIEGAVENPLGTGLFRFDQIRCGFGDDFATLEVLGG